jgi:hypothetical protein
VRGKKRKIFKREGVRIGGFRVLRLIVECGRRKKDKDLFVNDDEKGFFLCLLFEGEEVEGREMRSRRRNHWHMEWRRIRMGS